MSSERQEVTVTATVGTTGDFAKVYFHCECGSAIGSIPLAATAEGREARIAVECWTCYAQRVQGGLDADPWPAGRRA